MLRYDYGGVMAQVRNRIDDSLQGAGRTAARFISETAGVMKSTVVADTRVDEQFRLNQLDTPVEPVAIASAQSVPSNRTTAANGEAIADEFDRMRAAGIRARWAVFHPADRPKREFEAWYRDESDRPIPELHAESALCCWELSHWVAARLGIMSKQQLRFFTDKVPGRDFVSKLFPRERHEYLPGNLAVPQPVRGDLVVWGRGEHVAMATGDYSGEGPRRCPLVYSFWPPPDDPHEPDPVTGSWGREIYAVKVCRLDDLTDFIAQQAPNDPPPPILFGPGPW
ncbi:hypothetical protein IU486_01355 [Streptomyces gardneri]|uniref:hypothetical protein n=1 Tax=Nocardia sputi TaxID=2943705 RepID=UPI0018934CE3|nr:hypothetical protein [Nocardia sputi]MBF6163419.1 hypothetical protein [Streptomyces gardneri]